MDTTTLPPKGKLTLHYYLLQIGFWGGIGCFTGFQSVIVLDRGFTSADVGVFVAICNLAGILFQPQLGAWADRHPEVPIKRLLNACLVLALGVNVVFYTTRPGFWGTALIFLTLGILDIWLAPYREQANVGYFQEIKQVKGIGFQSGPDNGGDDPFRPIDPFGPDGGDDDPFRPIDPFGPNK